MIHDIAQALPLTHLVDGLSGAIVDNEGSPTIGSRCSCSAWWADDRRGARFAGLFLGSAQALSGLHAVRRNR